MLDDVADHVRAEAAAYTSATGVPGYLAGLYHGGSQVVVAHGLANAATGVPMTEDTGYLVGSITKVLTTTLVLRQVERGLVSLDSPVASYLPEFTLGGDILVRHLLTHTDGIDGDLFFPEGRGPEALRLYLDALVRHCGTLFEPGAYLSYSNAAFLVAGRLLEVVTGSHYHDLLERDLYAAAGMTSSCTSAEQAILRRTAVGHFADPATGGVRRTDAFMLPESWSSAGSTPVATIADLLAFARTQLAGGVAPLTGKRVLSGELVARMQTPSAETVGLVGGPIGLGWPVEQFGSTPVLWHGGGSPGGSANLIVVPSRDLAFATFGNDPRAGLLHDRLASWVLHEYLGLPARSFASRPGVADLARYEGTYRSHQLRVDIIAVEGQLEQSTTFEPLDALQERILKQFAGGQWPFPPQRFDPVGANLFAPTGAPVESLSTIRGSRTLVHFLGEENGHPTYRHANGRLMRRV